MQLVKIVGSVLKLARMVGWVSLIAVSIMGFGSGAMAQSNPAPAFPPPGQTAPAAAPAPVAPAPTPVAPTPVPVTPANPAPANPGSTTGGQMVPNPQQFRALEQPNSKLSFKRAEELVTQANAALQAKDFTKATDSLLLAYAAYNQRSNFHQQLGKSFAGVQNQISEAQRDLARQAAELRDRTSYDLAVVYRAAGKPEDAVNQLVQVLTSQSPTRELGKQAYQQLFEIGFVDTPYPS